MTPWRLSPRSLILNRNLPVSIVFQVDRSPPELALLRHPFCHGLMQEAHLATEKAAILAPTSSPDFEVSINTDVIKNMGGGADAVTRLHLVLREEGLEWLSEERDGEETAKPGSIRFGTNSNNSSPPALWRSTFTPRCPRWTV